MSQRFDEIISYAQNYEDIYIWVLLNGQKKGFYIDVGANDPVTDSVTYFFYKRGWTGINIDPNKEVFKLLNKSRKKDINLQMGIGASKTELSLRSYTKRSGWSTLSEAVKQKNLTEENLDYEEYRVEVDTLARVCDQYDVKDIDFLKVDVEGFEHEVFKGNNWKKYRPKIICAEMSNVQEDWFSTLEDNGYTRVFHDGLNVYYASKEYLPNIDLVDSYKRLVTENKPIISLRNYQPREHYIARQEQKIESLRRRHERVSGKLRWAHEHPVRFMLGRIYHFYIKRDQKS